MAEEETAIMDICFDEAITVAKYSKTPDSKQKQAYLDQLKKTSLSGGEENWIPCLWTRSNYVS